MILGNRPAARATTLVVLSSCSFGSLTTLTLLIIRNGMPLLPAMLWRYFLAAAILFVLLHRVLGGISRREIMRLMLVGGLGQALITYLSLRALDYLPVGPLAFLFYTYPAWVALIALVRGTEEVTLPRLAALVLAMAGIAIMVGMPSAGKLDPIGIVLALGTALIYALYLPSLHKVQAGIPPMISTFYLITGVFLAFLVANIATSAIMVPETPSLWGLLAMLAVVGTVVAFAALISGLKALGPLRTSIIATIEPFFTALLGVVVLGEKLTVPTLFGGVLIAGAILLIHWTDGIRLRLGSVA